MQENLTIIISKLIPIENTDLIFEFNEWLLRNYILSPKYSFQNKSSDLVNGFNAAILHANISQLRYYFLKLEKKISDARFSEGTIQQLQLALCFLIELDEEGIIDKFLEQK